MSVVGSYGRGVDLGYYASPGPLTQLTQDQIAAVRQLSRDPEGLCRIVQGLVVQPGDAFGAGLSPERMEERNTRPAAELLERITELDPSPLDQPRPEARRVVGTCRHFAVLATAFLRAVGIPTRARCGFASYFVPGKHVDHWIVEHWLDSEQRWARIDAEILGADIVGRPHDLAPGEFLTGGEAWHEVRSGHADAASFGVVGTENWGPGEIRGNAIRDLAALHKVEMLPWDEWGRMAESYEGRTGDDFDRSIDDLAAVCATADRDAVQAAYDEFAIPAALVR